VTLSATGIEGHQLADVADEFEEGRVVEMLAIGVISRADMTGPDLGIAVPAGCNVTVVHGGFSDAGVAEPAELKTGTAV
jgi:hypothetical protein